MKNFILISICLAQFNVLVDSMPKFIGELKNLTVCEGRDASFTCTVTNLGGHRVAWIKSDEKAILAIHDHVITNNERLYVTHNDKDTWTLQIWNVQQKDSGEYMCQVNSVPMVSQVAILRVVVPPQISDQHSTSDLSVAEGMSAKLHCAATGYPQPEIVWRREGKDSFINIRNSKHGKVKKKKRVKSKTLFLPTVSREDMGNYMCVASNGVPPAVSKSIKLIVNFQPHMDVTNQLIGAPIMTQISLSCIIEASPRPINFWTDQSGAMIVPNSKYKIVEKYINAYRATSTLLIRTLEKEDFSEFKCVSKNTIGQGEETIKLYEIHVEPTRKSVVTTKEEHHQIHSSDENNSLNRQHRRWEERTGEGTLSEGGLYNIAPNYRDKKNGAILEGADEEFRDNENRSVRCGSDLSINSIILSALLWRGFY